MLTILRTDWSQLSHGFAGGIDSPPGFPQRSGGVGLASPNGCFHLDRCPCVSVFAQDTLPLCSWSNHFFGNHELNEVLQGRSESSASHRKVKVPQRAGLSPGCQVQGVQVVSMSSDVDVRARNCVTQTADVVDPENELFVFHLQ